MIHRTMICSSSIVYLSSSCKSPLNNQKIGCDLWNKKDELNYTGHGVKAKKVEIFADFLMNPSLLPCCFECTEILAPKNVAQLQF